MPSDKRQSFIIGASGFAAEVYSWLTTSVDTMIGGFVVKNTDPLISPISGIPCYHEEDIVGATGDCYLAIGQTDLRADIVKKLKRKTELNFPNLIHNTCIIDPLANLGEGNLIMPYAIVCSKVKMGSFNILNIYSSLGHDVEVECFVTLAPYATMNGKSICREYSFLGTHSTVGPGIVMEKYSILSANSFASINIPKGAIGYGVPAKIIKKRGKLK